MPKSQCTEYCDREKEIVELEAEMAEIAGVCARSMPDELQANREVLKARAAHLGTLGGELQQHVKSCAECQRGI
jgi:hypothetical protein